MHPILFRIPFPGWELPLLGKVTSIPIYSYGVMLGLSIVVGWYLTLGLAKRDGLPQEEMANNYVFTALLALFGSRVLYVVTNPDEFKSFSDLVALRRGGLVAYGGFLGGFLGSWLYLRSKKLPLLPWADVAVPSLATGLMITRVGCYLFGCDFGKRLSEGAPAFLKKLGTFPHWPEGTLEKGTGSPAWFAHVERNLIGPDATYSLPVHPTQLYESLVGLSLFGLVMLQRKHQRFRGQVFLLFTFAYGFLRYDLEILRDDAERGEFGPQMGEHVLVPGGLFLLALGYIFFISRALTNKVLRVVTQVAILVPAVALYLLLRPASFAEQVLVRLSTSQWVALLTGMAAAIAYGTFWDAAKAHPERAMALNLPGQEPPAEEVNEEAPRPKKRKKKKKEKVVEDAPAEESTSPKEDGSLPAEPDAGSLKPA
ncbi:MAG: prolipoprotein diacylglyceryl transferase [Myxococcales bacterium]|nr:prolipoprotein diacylglyceryl transferase [Polyangiaceae bacterium]MDW8250791.1 prolipoprotein diacylglyceryl transferase [Myxococcales bacterium]